MRDEIEGRAASRTHSRAAAAQPGPSSRGTSARPYSAAAAGSEGDLVTAAAPTAAKRGRYDHTNDDGNDNGRNDQTLHRMTSLNECACPSPIQTPRLAIPSQPVRNGALKSGASSVGQRPGGEPNAVARRDLRHAYGSRLASRGLSARQIADAMGHKRTSTTELYIQRFNGDQADGAGGDERLVGSKNGSKAEHAA